MKRTTNRARTMLDALEPLAIDARDASIIATTLDAHGLGASWETYDHDGRGALIVETDDGGAIILVPEPSTDEWYAWYASDSSDPSLLVGGSMVEETYDHGPNVVVVLANAIEGRSDVTA